MQNFIEQTYQDSTYQEALDHGYDIVQLKYDGWFDRIEIQDGIVKHHSSTSRVFDTNTLLDVNLAATFLGENMRGTQWSQQEHYLGRRYLFDCLFWVDINLTQMKYRDRYRVLRAALSRLPATYEAVQCYPITHRDELWSGQVATGAFEGLIYRRSMGDFTDTILREKAVVTEDLQVVGYTEGQGRLLGTLGAINGKTTSGVLIDVGGGLSDDLRTVIWTNRERYLGRWFEVEAKARFKSGSLRHPNFIRWRDDK